MKRIVLVALLVCGLTGGLYAQTVDTTVCAVLKNPTAFNGKMVRIKGTVVSGFDQFVVHDGNCGQTVNGIWITYPAGTKAKGGPLATVRLEPAHNFSGTITPEKRTPVVLDRDKQFKHFDSLLAHEYEPWNGICLGCREYEVLATLVGRLDAVASATLDRNGSKIVGLGGFGNMNAYPARLVLKSVSGVTDKKVDYSKTEAVTNKVRPGPEPKNPYMFDAVATLQKDAAALEPGQLTSMIQKDAEALPTDKQKIHDGVSVIYGRTTDDVLAGADKSGTQNSPDGVLFICTLNRDQLGASLGMALLHMGQHINDLRNPPRGNEDAPPVIQENNGWVVSTAFAISDGAKFIVLPGAYLMWNKGWPQADSQTKMQDALNSFLANEAMLSR